MTETSEISDKLTAVFDIMREQGDAELTVIRLANKESVAVELLVQAAGGKRRFTRDGQTYVAYKTKNGRWSIGVARVQKGVEA